MVDWLGRPVARRHRRRPDDRREHPAVAAADPGRVHTEGRIVRAVVEDARDSVAALLGTRPRQVVFTSGGTEAVNAATWGATRADPGQPGAARRRRAFVASATHRSAWPPWSVSASTVSAASTRPRWTTPSGAARPRGRRPRSCTARRPTTRWAPSSRWPRWWRRATATESPSTSTPAPSPGISRSDFDDAGRRPAVGQRPQVRRSARRSGALLVRRGLRLDPLLVGGEQERARRAGLENVPAIVGFGAAADALTGTGRLEAEAAAARAADRAVCCAAATAVDGVHAAGGSATAGCPTSSA